MYCYPGHHFNKMCQNFTFLSGSFWLFSVVCILTTQVVYMSSRFWLLAVGSRDLSQAEREITAIAKLSKNTKRQLFSIKTYLCSYSIHMRLNMGPFFVQKKNKKKFEKNNFNERFGECFFTSKYPVLCSPPVDLYCFFEISIWALISN